MVALHPPITQIALDYSTVEEALAMAGIALEAGIDWLEAGTPLITCQGFKAIGALATAFPNRVVLADYKTMDSGFKNVQRTHEQGAHLMTVCANASDETVRSAIDEGKKLGIGVVVDTIGVKNQAERARQCAAWGADILYLHYSADERRADPSRDSTQWLDEVLAAVDCPVGAGCFGIEDALRAVSKGAEYVVIGHPLISGPDPLAALCEFASQVRANYRPRSLPSRH
ncbi:MAG TPA: orotidine 5'-phosphate decarboxylase / HUMPS family protein [Verrucomicrobiales bacterium]|nr:orotidine 5'-phosphate decarboxylase / HUMPS family protein [Verrucomicrobiales bacterium]